MLIYVLAILATTKILGYVDYIHSAAMSVDISHITFHRSQTP